jgi:hypothetical protein
VAWHSNLWSVAQAFARSFSVSTEFQLTTGADQWWLTCIYGQSTDNLKHVFLEELRELHQVCMGAWLLMGDFNMVYHSEDKNNDWLNRRLMGQFHRFLNDSTLKEMHLQGRLFTWSNEQLHLTLERNGRAFISLEWDDLCSCCDLHSCHLYVLTTLHSSSKQIIPSSTGNGSTSDHFGPSL